MINSIISRIKSGIEINDCIVRKATFEDKRYADVPINQHKTIKPGMILANIDGDLYTIIL